MSPNSHHREEEDRRVDRAAQQRPRDLADGDVARAERRREHGVVGVRVLDLTKKLNVVSSSAPFIAAVASRPGRDERAGSSTVWPPTCRSPTSLPTPMPIDSKNRIGSAKPDRKMYHMRRYARTLRSTSRHGRRRQPTNGTAIGSGPCEASWRHAFNRRAKCRTPNARADRDARDEERDVPDVGPETRRCRSSRRGRARRRATAARATRARCEPVGQLADREERAREQEQRQDRRAA